MSASKENDQPNLTIVTGASIASDQQPASSDLIDEPAPARCFTLYAAELAVCRTGTSLHQARSHHSLPHG